MTIAKKYGAAKKIKIDKEEIPNPRKIFYIKYKGE